jgi:hypothetical protein
MRFAMIVIAMVVMTTPSEASKSCMSKTEARRHFSSSHIYCMARITAGTRRRRGTIVSRKPGETERPMRLSETPIHLHPGPPSLIGPDLTGQTGVTRCRQCCLTPIGRPARHRMAGLMGTTTPPQPYRDQIAEETPSHLPSLRAGSISLRSCRRLSS